MPAITPRDGSSAVVGTLWIEASPVIGIGKDDIGEGAADIDADQVHCGLIRRARRQSRNGPAGAELQSHPAGRDR